MGGFTGGRDGGGGSVPPQVYNGRRSGPPGAALGIDSCLPPPKLRSLITLSLCVHPPLAERRQRCYWWPHTRPECLPGSPRERRCSGPVAATAAHRLLPILEGDNSLDKGFAFVGCAT